MHKIILKHRIYNVHLITVILYATMSQIMSFNSITSGLKEMHVAELNYILYIYTHKLLLYSPEVS